MLALGASKKVVSDPARTLVHGGAIPLLSLLPIPFDLCSKFMLGLAFNDTQVVYHHMNCAL